MDETSRLLLYCLSSELRQDMLPGPEDEAAWSALADRAGRLGLSQFLYWRLQDRGISMPQGLYAVLRPRYWATATHNAHKLEQLRRILGSLADARVPVILLKGATLLGQVYPGPGSRPMRDVDLLIQASRVEQAAAVLQQMGYDTPATDGRGHTREFLRSYGGELAFEGGKGRWLSLDLHWRLVHHEGYRDFLDIDYDGLWQRARPAPEAVGGGLQLPVEDNLLYLALHLGLHHRLEVLSMYLDLDRVIRKTEAIDWNAFSARARAWRVRNVTYLSLALARELFSSPVPEDLLDALRPSRLRLAFLGRIVNASDIAAGQVSAGTKGERILHLLLTDRLWDLARATFKVLWPDREWLRLRYHLEDRGPVGGHRLRHLGRMFSYGLQALGELGGWPGSRNGR